MIENEGSNNASAQVEAVPAGVSAALAGFVSKETLAKVQAEEKPVATPEGNENKGAEENPNHEAKPKSLAEARLEKQQKEEAEKQAALEEEKKKAKPSVEEESEEEEEQEEEKKETKKSVFGIGNKPKQKQQDIKIENAEDAIKAINSKFGQNLKDVKDMPKFFESVEKMRVSAQKAETLEKENSQYKGILENLPSDFIGAIKEYYNGGDYMKVFANKPKFDFTKPAEKQDTKELVNHYFPGKFTDEDFNEEEPSSALEIALSASRDKYEMEKKAIDDRRATETKTASERLEAFKSSVGSSVDHLKKSFPEVSKDELQNVVKIIEGGPKSIVDFFYNQNGTVKQEAAEMLMMAIHGKSQIEMMMEVAANQAESRVNEEIVTRGADGPRPKKSVQAEGLSPEVQKLINDFGSFKEKKTY